jgi:uncharacterized damage-inducible protein DinB
MTTVDYIGNTLDFVHRALADARNGTDTQLHFVPESGSHSIAWCLWHTTRIEDLLINVRFQGGEAIWNARWAERTGLAVDDFGVGQTDTEARAVHIDSMEAFAEYQEAVWASTAAFLAAASEADLEREVPARQGTETIGQAISLHMLGHFNGHRGEINTLRGMQGMPTVMAAQGTH